MSVERSTGNIPLGYKQTEVGVIPEDWSIIPITKATDHIFLGLTTKVDYVDCGGVPLVRASDIADGKLRLSGTRTISARQHQELTKYHRAKKGDVLVSKSGSLGVCALVDIETEFSIYESIIVLQPNHLLNSEFLLWLMRDERTQSRMKGDKVGSSVGHLNIMMFRQLFIPLPDTPEQEAIAEALSDMDAFIESLEQLLSKKRQIKQGAMQELLTGKRRLPGFSGEWEVKKFSDLATIQRGASPRPIDSPIWFDDTSSIGWVRISDVTRTGMFLRETTQRLSSLGVQHSRPVSSGSLIMSICATVGRPVITEIDICIHDGFVVFDGLRVDKGLLYYILKSIEDDWSRHGQTGSQMNLNTGLINQTTITIPPTREEQTAIASILSDIDSEITALEEKLAKTRQIKQGMMQELLTGKIRLI